MRHEPIPWVYAVFSGTGFSREGANVYATGPLRLPLAIVGARLTAKRPVHPTQTGSPCRRFRGQARSYT